jgi:ADP-L-glycero-D-manno-heptose 6-epimerase
MCRLSCNTGGSELRFVKTLLECPLGCHAKLDSMIIVTGANGFIGSALVWQLNQRAYSHILAVDSVGLDQRNLLQGKAYSQFLLKDQLWEFLRSPKAYEVTGIFHMGACSATTEKNWEFLKENNLEYSQKIFQWAAKEQKTLIYASSAATYGDGEMGFDDQSPSTDFEPLNLYGKSKLLMDQWALEQKVTPHHWYGVRFFNVFGPNEYHKGSMSSLAYKAFHQIKKNGKLGLFKSYHPRYQDGEQKRDFVYVKDVIHWMVDLMEATPQNGIYNMGSGKARSWMDLAKAVFKSMNQDLNIDWLEMPNDIKNQYQYFTEAKMQRWQGQNLDESQWPLEKAVEDYVQNYLQKGDSLL